MQTTKRAFLKRTAAACAATAVLIGGTFAGAASAAPAPEPPVASSSTAAAPAPTATATATSLPPGLGTALERDLGISVEEFNSRSSLATSAADIQAKVSTTDPAAVVSLDGDTINIQTTAPAAAKAAAGSSKVAVTTTPSAPSVAKVDAASVDALFADYVGEFGATALQSIMVNANGELIIRTGDVATTSPMATQRSFRQAAKSSPNDFAAKYANVVVEPAQGPAGALATDVVNGEGYVAFDSKSIPRGLCSIGWNGFNKSGDPAVISAGHCTSDGTLEGTKLIAPPLEPLGTFGFSQFGGPGNSPAIDPFSQIPGNVGTDISVVDGINTALTQLAKVTDWTTPASPKDSGPQVTGVSDAVIGTPICKSGRTTGWSCGTVSEVGVFLVGGKNYPQNPKDPKPGEDLKDIRAVRGFSSVNLAASPGDSGGPIIAGTLAVGMVSAGIKGSTTYGVSLKDALAHTAGYTVKIFLNVPKLTTTAPVFRGGAVTGTVDGAPAGTTVSVTIEGVTEEAAVAADGTWTVKAPNAFGTFAVTAQAKNGFSTSETTTGSIEVIKQTLAAPAITAPAQNGTPAAPVAVVTGTGKAGATIELTGDVTGIADVGDDGTWSFPVSPALKVGSYTVTARQTLADWNDSPTVSNTFKVVEATPAPPASQAPATSAPPSPPTTTPAYNSHLAKTGASSSVFVVGGAGGLLLLGGITFLLLRRRSTK